MMHLDSTPTTTPASTAIVPLQSNDSAVTEAAVEVSEEINVPCSERKRWSKEETLALLKIRSDLIMFFRDNMFKLPLWAEVSRKMAELGYMRSAKKCREKFQNVYKYHRQTKKGKTYHFYDQLEDFETRSTSSLPPQPPLQPHHNNNTFIFSTSLPVTIVTPTVTNMINTLPSSSVHLYTQPMNVPSFQNISRNYLLDNSPSSSDVEFGSTRKRKKDRTLEELFERLKQIVDKQEEFLEAVEKREQERIIREESWRAQEIARINRDHESLAQERSMLASIMDFLQKQSENLPNQPTIQLQQPPQPSRPPPTRVPQAVVVQTSGITEIDSGDRDMRL